MAEWARGLLLTMTAGVAFAAEPIAPVQAGPAADFDLAAQPLVDALLAVCRRTDTNILIDRLLVGRRVAPALRGRFTVHQALTRLLAGSGLDFRFVDRETVVITGKAGAESADPDRSAAGRSSR